MRGSLSCLSVANDSSLMISRLSDTLSSIEEFQQLKNTIGDISFEIADSTYSRVTKNVIVLASDLFENQKPTLMAIEAALFETANLSQAGRFKKLLEDSNLTTPDEFVEQFERIEHTSALMCKKILRRIYPKERWLDCPMAYTTECFALHYFLQQSSGHSRDIWERYRSFFPDGALYSGTWKTPISKEEEFLVNLLLDIVFRMEDPEEDIHQQAAEDYKILTQIMELNSELKDRIEEVKQAANSRGMA